MADIWVLTLLGLGLIGILALTIVVGTVFVQDKNDGAQINKQLSIIGSVTGILVVMLGAAAYMYFTANINYMPSFLFVMTFLNMFLSVFAVSAASLQVSK